MRIILIVIGLMLAMPAWADQCLPEPDQATAVARSVQESVAMGVTDGSPWWAQQQINGQPCVVIESTPRGNGYDFTSNPMNGATTTGLSQVEITTLTTIIPQSSQTNP